MADTQAPQTAAPAPAPEQDDGPATTARLLQDTVVVDDQGEQFTFGVPTVKDEMKVGSMLPRLRRLADPESAGEPLSTLDEFTMFRLRAVALFLTCLRSTTAKWVYSADVTGKPTIDWEKWPEDATPRVMNIAMAFVQEVSTFHLNRAANAQRPRV